MDGVLTEPVIATVRKGVGGRGIDHQHQQKSHLLLVFLSALTKFTSDKENQEPANENFKILIVYIISAR